MRVIDHFPSLVSIGRYLGLHGRLEIGPLLAAVVKLAEPIQHVSLVLSCQASGPFTDKETRVYCILWLHDCIYLQYKRVLPFFFSHCVLLTSRFTIVLLPLARAGWPKASSPADPTFNYLH